MGNAAHALHDLSFLRPEAYQVSRPHFIDGNMRIDDEVGEEPNT